MILARRDYERLTFELATLRATVQQLEVRAAVAQSGREWLETRVNSLEVERAALTERLLQISYPVPQIVRSNEMPARPVEAHGRPVDEYAIPEHLATAMPPRMPTMVPPNIPAAMKATKPTTPPDDYDSSISALHASEVSFDDMGEAAAAAAGIRHDAFGNVEYTK